MTDILEFIGDLRELQTLYSYDELRDIDFELFVQKYTRRVEQFELEFEEQQNATITQGDLKPQ